MPRKKPNMVKLKEEVTVTIDRRHAPLPIEEMNHVRSRQGDSHKICSKCGKSIHIEELHMTKRVKKDEIKNIEKKYLYRRADCKECRSKERKEYYKKHGR